MKKEDIIKWLLIAGAAYMVYRYLQQSGIFNQLLPGGGTQPAATGGAGTSTSTGAALSPANIEAAMRAAIIAQGENPSAPMNGWEANYWWVRSSLYNGVEVGPGQLGLVAMDAPTAVAEAAKLDLATMASRISAYLATKASGVAGLIASGPVMVSPTGQVIDMEEGFGGFKMPSPWTN